MASDFDGGDLPEQGKRRIKLTWPTIWKSLAVLIGILIVVLLVTLLTRSLQSSSPTPDGTAAAFASTMTSIYDQQATFTAAAITPTLDPNIAALQTQNAQLAQSVTDQAATNQAQAQVIPTQPPIVVTELPQVTALPPTQQPAIVVQPTAEVKIVTATPLPQQPTATVKIVTATPLPQQPIQPANLVQQGCLPKSDFVSIVNQWHSADKSNPSPAIEELDKAFEQGASIGEQWSTAPYTISMGPTGSVVFWTNTFNKPNDKVTASGVIEKIFLTGGYGIYAAWDTDVNVPTPGRSAWLCERLDPANDFPWWGK